MYVLFPPAGLGLESRNGPCITFKRSDMRGDKPPGADKAREEQTAVVEGHIWAGGLGLLQELPVVQGATTRLLSYPRMAPRGRGPGGHWSVLGPRVTCVCDRAWPGRKELSRTSPAIGGVGDPGDQLLRPRKKGLHSGSFQQGDMATKDQTCHPLHAEVTPGTKRSLWGSWRAQK